MRKNSKLPMNAQATAIHWKTGSPLARNERFPRYVYIALDSLEERVMRQWVIAAYAAAMGFASAGLTAAPASAMPVVPAASVEDPLLQTVADGCPRNYYRSYGRCVPNSRGYRGPRYGDGYAEAPRYYVRPYHYDSPGYFDGPGYYDGPRYWAVPRRSCPPGTYPGLYGRCVSDW
jgi:hypothetical protein